jgi:hypothetical protein
MQARQYSYVGLRQTKICIFNLPGGRLGVNPVRQIVDDTKVQDPRWLTEMAGSVPGIAVEKPEEVMAKIELQATYLGPVMEEILRATQERGQSHWGLNE